MYQRKWKDTKCFLPPDHNPVFNADMIIRKPTHVITTLKWILKNQRRSMGHICTAMWLQIQQAACNLKSDFAA